MVLHNPLLHFAKFLFGMCDADVLQIRLKPQDADMGERLQVLDIVDVCEQLLALIYRSDLAPSGL